MRRTRYLFVLLLTGMPTLVQLGFLVQQVLWSHGAKGAMAVSITTTGTLPIPPTLPWQLRGGIFLVFVLLFLYRIWQFIKQRRVTVPDTFAGLASVLASIAFYSFLLSMLVLLATMLLAGSGGASGVPAGVVGILALYLAPLSFLITEIRSLLARKPRAA